MQILEGGKVEKNKRARKAPECRRMIPAYNAGLIDKGLSYLLAGEGVGAITAEDEDLTIFDDLIGYW